MGADILIIQDCEILRNVLGGMLEKEGSCVLLAKDGVAGLQISNQVHPHPVLLDILAPRMDGWDSAHSTYAASDGPTVASTSVERRMAGYFSGRE